MEGGEYLEKTINFGGYQIFMMLTPYIIMIVGAIGIIRCILSNRCDNAIINDSDDLKMDDFGRSICSTEVVRFKISQV